MVIKVGSEKPQDFNMTALAGVDRILHSISERWNSADFAPTVAALKGAGLINETPKAAPREVSVDVLAGAGVQLVDSHKAAASSSSIAFGTPDKTRGGGHGTPA